MCNFPQSVSLFSFYCTSFFCRTVLTACEHLKSIVENYNIISFPNVTVSKVILFPAPLALAWLACVSCCSAWWRCPALCGVKCVSRPQSVQ